MKDWFKEEKKKEKLKITRDNKKINMKLPKDMKDVLLLAGGTILLAEAVNILKK